MDERKVMYLAHVSERVDDTGCFVWTTSGHLTTCGRYVEQNHAYRPDTPPQIVLNPISRHWCPTAAEARAVAAEKIRAMGERLLRQADELEQAARQEVAS